MANPSYSTFKQPPAPLPPPLPPRHPHAQASWFSRVLLSWVTPLMDVGNHKQLAADDIWDLEHDHQSAPVTLQFARDYAQSRSIMSAFFKSFGWRFALAGLALLLAMLCNLFGPLVLNRVLDGLTVSPAAAPMSSQTQTQSRQQKSQQAFDGGGDLVVWILALFVATVAQAFASNYGLFDMESINLQFTAALKSMMYQKSLRLSPAARKETSVGAISNMYLTDCFYINMAAYYTHQMWLLPLQIVLAGYMLYEVLGVACFAGLAVVALMLLGNSFFTKQAHGLHTGYMQLNDVRMKRVTEVFKSIGVVKLNAWEDKMVERVEKARADEVANIWQFLTLNLWLNVITWGMPVFICVAAFGVHVGVLQRELTPAIVFTSLALFQLIQAPLRGLAQAINILVGAKVATKRVGDFLDMEEIRADSVLKAHGSSAAAVAAMTPSSATSSTRSTVIATTAGADAAVATAVANFRATDIIVAIENGVFSWDNDGDSDDSEDGSVQLRNVNMRVTTGSLVVVSGRVGSGKSSLCSALLGEMVKRGGSVYVGGSVAYCSQQPWIQNMTVRENILFGLPFERSKYDKVLDACALVSDLRSLPAGDNTEIGERGVNVSGGQKARIALARACYSDASVYILDSPLAAVDAIVQNEIFTKCLLGLLRHKTIVLVTHNPEIIESPFVDSVVSIGDGGVAIQTHSNDSHERRRRRRDAHVSAVSPLAACGRVDTSEFDAVEKSNEYEVGPKTAMKSTPPLTGVVSALADSRDKAAAADNETERLVKPEVREEGRVSRHVLLAYYRAIGGFPVALAVLTAQVLWQALQISSDFWLGQWSSDAAVSVATATAAAAVTAISGESEAASSSGGQQPRVSAEYRMAVYALLGLLSAVMFFARTFAVYSSGLRAAKTLFSRMTRALVHAPTSFFDANPIGRILTRYSNDVSDCDFSVPLVLSNFFANLFSVACTLLTAAAIIQWRGVLLLPVGVLYVHIAGFYLHPAREIERLNKTTWDPVISHLSESIEGGAVIRAFGHPTLARFNRLNDAKLDLRTKIQFAKLAVSQWLALRIQLVGSLLVLVVAYSLVLLRDEISAAVVGIVFAYVLKISSSLGVIVQSWSLVETMMVSPERLQEYIDVPQEAAARVPSADPPASASWPSSGSVQFRRVSFRYKSADALVLKDVSFEVRGGEKIGIVGRTGAGKSSLTMALFRINELAAGSIAIDGVDVGKIGLATLREKLSIIPQNPVLLEGTLRSCLDPFGEFGDEELWTSIRQVGLSDRIAAESDKLECVVEENGENFSVGERQMLCMARALLRHSRIVIFDEATAAIDHETDKALQQVIRTAFARSTVLTIAHRLDTVLDSDRILVLDGGRIAEFASPAELVRKGNGHFFDLMKEGGYLDKFRASQASSASSASSVSSAS